MELTIRVVGEDLADIDFGERSAGEGRARLFLGIQRGQEVIDTVPVTAETATFTAHFSVSPLPNGGTNFLGPYAHGTRDARFFYRNGGAGGGKSRCFSPGMQNPLQLPIDAAHA